MAAAAVRGMARMRVQASDFIIRPSLLHPFIQLYDDDDIVTRSQVYYICLKRGVPLE